jgi:hypothetical protein
MRWLFRGDADLRARLQAALADLALEREHAARERTECQATQAELRGSLRDAERECAAARADRAAAADQAVRCGAALAGTQQALADAKAALAGTRARLTAAQTQLATTEAALAAARHAPPPGPDHAVLASREGIGCAGGDSMAQPPPIVDDLIQLADRLAEMDADGLTPDQFGGVIRWLGDQAQSLLEACEVNSFADIGGRIDPARHHVVSTRPTADPAYINQIAESVHPGYAWRDGTLRPQAVIAYAQGGSSS